VTDASRSSAKLVGNSPVAGGWRLLRLQQAALAAEVRPGQRVAVSTAGSRLEGYVSHSRDDWVALLAPPADATAARLPLHAGLDVEGPLGDGWRETVTEQPAVVLASGSGIGAALYMIERLDPPPRLVLLGSGGLPLPFRPLPSSYVIAGLPPPVIAAAPMLEQRRIPSRIADTGGRPGCFEGPVIALFELWLASHPAAGIEVFACLPDESTAELQRHPALRLHVAG
jgi:hypothetical protein